LQACVSKSAASLLVRINVHRYALGVALILKQQQ